MTEPSAPVEQPVLILIHGATLNGEMWGPVRRHLDRSFRVLTPDLPGHGSRRHERFTMASAAQTVQAAVRSVAPAPVILVGDSLGGYTALASAAAVPAEQLRGLVVGGCTANLEGFQTMLHFNAKATLFKILLALFGEEKIVRSSEGKVRKLLADNGVHADDIDRIIAAGLSFKVFEQAVDELRGVDYFGKLAAIKQPVLLLNGDKDHVMLHQEARFLKAGPHVSGQRFDCEHGVSLVRGQGFAEALTRFAKRVR